MLYTPTQAAAVTGLPLKSVQKAIDSGTITVRMRRNSGTARRYLNSAALVCLRLEAEGLRQLPASLRKRIYRDVTRQPRQNELRLSNVLRIDVAKARKGVALAVNRLRKVEGMIVSDPEILGGTPVFRGTRVPVHAISEMLNSGTTEAEILEGYPSLNALQVALAPLYAQAHPKRGRPAPPPWAGSKPIRRSRRRLTSAA